MAVAYRASATFVGNNTSPTVTIPASVANADVIVVQVNAINTAVPITPPAGWTVLDEQADDTLWRGIYYKTATGSDASTVVHWTLTTSAKWTALVWAGSGADASLLAVQTTIEGTQGVTTHTAPSIGTSAGSMVVEFIADRASGGGANTSWTAPGSFTKRQDAYSASPGVVSAAVADQAYASANGSAGGGTWTEAVANADCIITSVAVKSVAGSGGGSGSSIAYVVGASAIGSSTSAKITIPSTGIAQGNLMIIGIVCPVSGGPAQAAAGWTEVLPAIEDSTCHMHVFQKVADTSDLGVQQSFTLAGGGGKWCVLLEVYSGASISTATSHTETGSATVNHITSTVTVPASGWLVQMVADRASGGANVSWTPPAGVTKRHDAYSAASGVVTIASGDSNGTVSGTQGGGTWVAGTANSDSSQISIALSAGGSLPNQLPIANAGTDQTVDPFVVVQLDGSGSSDPDGTIASYTWRQISKNPTSAPSVSFSSTSVARPTFTARVE